MVVLLGIFGCFIVVIWYKWLRIAKTEVLLVQQVNVLIGEMSDLKDRLEVLESRAQSDNSLEIHSSMLADAMRLASQGMSAHDISVQLRISRGEAELIAALHNLN